jgi:hypothetical protein
MKGEVILQGCHERLTGKAKRNVSVRTLLLNVSFFFLLFIEIYHYPENSRNVILYQYGKLKITGKIHEYRIYC